MKKVLSFFGLCAYVVGAVGGFGYCCFYHQYHIAIAIVILAVMAFPTLKKCFNEMMS